PERPAVPDPPTDSTGRESAPWAAPCSSGAMPDRRPGSAGRELAPSAGRCSSAAVPDPRAGSSGRVPAADSGQPLEDAASSAVAVRDEPALAGLVPRGGRGGAPGTGPVEGPVAEEAGSSGRVPATDPGRPLAGAASA